MIRVSIIILNWNGKKHLMNCLNSIKETVYCYDYEVIIVDQASTDGSVELIENEFPEIVLIKNKENVGIPKGANKAINKAKAELIFFLGNDTIPSEGFIVGCMNAMNKDKRIGIVGSTLIPPEWLDKVRPEKKWRYRDNVCSQAMMVRKEVFDEVGLYDEENFSPYGGEETDWIYRAERKGWKVVETRESIVGHIGEADTKWQNPDSELLLQTGRLKAMLFNKSFFGLMKRSLGMARIFIQSFEQGTTKTLLKSYWINLKNWKTISMERKKRGANWF